MADLFPAFMGTKEVLAPAISQVSLIHNNQYAKKAYSGVAYSAPLHLIFAIQIQTSYFVF